MSFSIEYEFSDLTIPRYGSGSMFFGVAELTKDRFSDEFTVTTVWLEGNRLDPSDAGDKANAERIIEVIYADRNVEARWHEALEAHRAGFVPERPEPPVFRPTPACLAKIAVGSAMR